jgi:hypothetical protein
MACVCQPIVFRRTASIRTHCGVCTGLAMLSVHCSDVSLDGSCLLTRSNAKGQDRAVGAETRRTANGVNAATILWPLDSHSSLTSYHELQRSGTRRGVSAASAWWTGCVGPPGHVRLRPYSLQMRTRHSRRSRTRCPSRSSRSRAMFRGFSDWWISSAPGQMGRHCGQVCKW